MVLHTLTFCLVVACLFSYDKGTYSHIPKVSQNQLQCNHIMTKQLCPILYKCYLLFRHTTSVDTDNGTHQYNNTNINRHLDTPPPQISQPHNFHQLNTRPTL